jgi:hypothetical protein
MADKVNRQLSYKGLNKRQASKFVHKWRDTGPPGAGCIERPFCRPHFLHDPPHAPPGAALQRLPHNPPRSRAGTRSVSSQKGGRLETRPAEKGHL